MAPKSKARISESDEYDTDERLAREDAEQPKRKKARVEKKSKPSTSTAATVPGGGARDEDGSEYWEVSPLSIRMIVPIDLYHDPFLRCIFISIC